MDDNNYKILINSKANKEPFFSVAMLSYNSAELINDALNGIYNQSFNDFELLLINDASMDDTDSKVNTNVDDRLTYVKNNTNQGVGKSRELAIDIAKGKYIVYVDVDDIVDKDLLLCLKQEIDKNNPDFIIYGFCERYLDKNDRTLWSKERLPFDAMSQYYKITGKVADKNHYSQYIDGIDLIQSLLIHLEDKTILGYPWNKCYKKQIIVDNNIHFENIGIYEDILFNVDYYKHINNISLINKVLYLYNNKVTKQSITTKDYDNYFELSKSRIKKIYDYIKECNKVDYDALDILKRINIRYAYSELNRCINRNWTSKELAQRFDEIRNDELFESILNSLNTYKKQIEKKGKSSIVSLMQNSFIDRKRNLVLFIARIINFVNKYMYSLYLKIAK